MSPSSVARVQSHRRDPLATNLRVHTAEHLLAVGNELINRHLEAA
jgi:hypothetical protein